MIQKTKRPISILLVLLMIVGMFSVLPISASAAEWTFKLNSNFSGEWNADTDVVSEQSVELNLSAGDYEFEIVAYEDGNLSSYRGNAQAGSFTETYSQTMHANGGHAKFHADGGKYTLTYNAGDGLLTIKPVYVAEIDGTYYKTLEAAFAAAAATGGCTITVLADCAGNGIIVPEGKFVNGGLTVDFKGHTYTVDGETVGSTGTETNGFQLLKGNEIDFLNGTIYSEKAKILVQNYSNLGLDGMTLTLNNPNYTSAYTLSNNNGNADIHNTTINANPAGGFAFDVCRYASYQSINVAVTGEKSVINGNVEISASDGDPKFGFSLILDGGTLNGNIVVDPSAAAAMESAPDRASVNKAAGFDQAAPEGFEWKNNGNGTSTLVALPYAAKIGNNKYRTLEEAFAAAVDGDTITLLSDCTGNGIVVPQGKFATGLTVDFDDNTYTIDGETVGSTGTETNGFQLLKDNKITFKNGIITSAKAKILVQNYSNLTLLGMMLTLNNPNYASAYTLSNNNGDVVIDSTTINANPAGGFAFDVCRYSSYPFVHVTVKGGSDIQGDVEISASGSDAKEGFSLTLEGGTMDGNIVVDASAQALVGEKNKVTKADTFTKDAPEGFKWVSNEDGTASLAPIPYVAKIGSTNYETLEAAFAAAKDGETITVLTDCAGNGIKAPQGKFATGLTVDFAGHTYTVSGTPVGSTGTETIGFQLLKDNKITFKNGTITGNSNENTDLQRMIQNYSDLTLENMTVSMVGRYYDQITVSTCNGKTVIKDSKISAPDYTWANITDPATVRAAALTVGTFSSYPSIDVTVEGTSVINGDVNVSDDNNKKAFSLTLKGGELNGKINLDENAKAAIDDTASTANVTKADSFIQEAPEGYRWVDSAETGKKTLAPIPYVAQIGSNKYETLAEAFGAAQDGDTITLLDDCTGDGIKAPQGKFADKGLTVDFAGFTYSVDGETVGSSGTETIGFQLLKDNKITFKNGTITGDSTTNTKLQRMIQNYSDLTLDNMTVSMVGLYRDQITVSTCNGKTVINNSKISAPDYTWANITDPATVGAAALAVGTFSSYPSIDVTVEGNSTINGDVNVSDDNNKKAFSLKLNGGKLNGKINLDENAKAAIDDAESNANVTKADTFTQAAPEGYEWKDNGNGTASLAKIVDLFAGYGLTLHGDIGLIFYLDPAAVGVDAAAVRNVSVSFTCDKYTGTVTDFTREGDRIKVAYYVPAAYMASPVHAYSVTINGATSNETNDYSVQQYALRVIADPSLITKDEASQIKAVKLMKEMLNYGAKAKAVFQTQMSAPEAAVYATIPNYTMTTVTADMIDAAIEKEATDMSTVHPEPDANFYAPSVIYLSKTTLRMYFEIPTGKGSKNPDAYTGSQSNWYYWVDVTNIPAAELDEQQEFKVNGVTFYYSVLDYAKAVVAGGSSAQKDLAASLYLYNQAANAFFAD